MNACASGLRRSGMFYLSQLKKRKGASQRDCEARVVEIDIVD